MLVENLHNSHPKLEYYCQSIQWRAVQCRVLLSVLLVLIVGQSDLLMIVIVSNGAVGSATSPWMAVMATLAVLPCQWQLKWATLAEVILWLRDGNRASALCPIVGEGVIKCHYLPPLLLIDSATVMLPQVSSQQSHLRIIHRWSAALKVSFYTSVTSDKMGVNANTQQCRRHKATHDCWFHSPLK